MRIHTFSRRAFVMLAACSAMACGSGPGEPVEQPAQIHTSIDFASLADVGTQWWAQAGVERAFYFSVRNVGRTAEHVPLTVTSGPNLRVVSVECVNGTASCLDPAAGSAAWAIASIGKNDQIRVIVRAIEQNAQSYRAQMTLTARLPGEARPWDDSAVHNRAVSLADRSVALEAPASAAAGNEIQLRVTLANLGPDFFYESRLPTLPPGVTAQAIDCTMNDGSICITGTLDASDVGVRANQAAVLRYRVTVPADYRGPLTISKTLRSEGDLNPADNSASVTLQVGPPGAP